MDTSGLKELINKGEGISIEFKASQEELTQSGFETVVAFLNTIGGYIFLGVSDNGTIVGIDEDSASTIKTNFANLMNNNEKINPSMPLMLQETYIDSKLVLYVYIPESSEVHKLNSKYIYIRTEEGDKDITNNQYALKKLYVRKSGEHFEDKVYHDLTIDDFDMDTVAYAKKLSILNDEHSNWKNLSNEDILKTFYKQDSTTGEYGYTNAALLLFGKTESIANKISWYKVDVLKRFNDLERYDDRFTCEDNLIKSYDEIIKYILDKIDQPFYLSPNGVTYNAVNVVVRELVSNVLIHRDFLDATGTQILLYRDRIEVSNPNNPKTYKDVEMNDLEPFSKNPIIAKTFRKIGYADELGSGFEKIENACVTYFKSTPVVKDKEVFKCIVRLISDNETNRIIGNQNDIIINYIKTNGRINNEECRKLLNVERSKSALALSSLVESKKIFRHGNGKATYYDLNE